MQTHWMKKGVFQRQEKIKQEIAMTLRICDCCLLTVASVFLLPPSERLQNLLKKI